jgi:hypothetical protein
MLQLARCRELQEFLECHSWRESSESPRIIRNAEGVAQSFLVIGFFDGQDRCIGVQHGAIHVGANAVA